VEAPLTVDGALDEPFWSECDVGTGLIDTRTHQPAREQTLVRVAFTQTHLYVGVECLDTDMAAIRATERGEDRSFVADDWVEVHVDPPHNHRGKYAFFTNPLGTRADANEGPSGQFNYGWSAEWDCAARLHADRWSFEMRIPLKVLNYFRRDGQTWGFNITRLQRRTDTTSFWSFSATDVYKPRHFGHLTGLDLASAAFDRNWVVTPYLSARTDFNGDTDTFLKAGLDVGVRLTPAITTALALNPDFGQVEADDDTIELRDTERFLPEKRLFFREGDELIRMPHRLYYSRRFTDIDAALKASGLLDGFAFAFQNLQSSLAHDGPYYGNSTVLRVSQDLRERSYLGYYFADSELDQGHSRVGSVDGYVFLTDAWRCRWQGAVAEEVLRDDSRGLDKDRLDFLGNASLLYERYPWNLGLTYNALTKGFDPLLGYVPRRDIFGPSWLGAYRRESGTAWYKRLTLSYDTQWYRNDRQQTTVHDHEWWASTVLRNDLGLRCAYENEFHRPHTNWRCLAGVEPWASDYWKSIELQWAGGIFQDIPYHEVALGKRYKFWERLPLRHEFVVRFEEPPPGRDDVVWLNRVVFDLFLADRMWLKSSLQHRHDGRHNLSLIYGWEFRRNTWWYLVFNQVDDGTEAGSSVFTKLTYTF